MKSAADELNYFQPAQDINCGEYSQAFVETSTGCLIEVRATDICGYYCYSVAD